MKNTDNTHFMDKVVESLRKAAIEIEEFQVQAALGKAEAHDAYEVAKKHFNQFIHESKSKVREGKEQVNEINAKLDELRVQLALGKAETKEKFIEQKKLLLKSLHELEVKIKSNPKVSKMYAFMQIEIEKFRVKLDVLEEKFEEGKESAKIAFEKRKAEFNEFINGVKTKREKKQETKWEHFQTEVSEAFTHLKRAFEPTA
ncbi:hypothetical protein [Muriicola sp. Z0-33]|uniref:hypothetical protein n=1 Tax=Muriicola sp. Z0-33 TaxID=2816957 RepID=UPI002236F029|nr:hypothetical protein [Muriicola sp. Z0-33]MCW5515437.1 hypothetical protein [Muriicola sp. Z0-33]